MRIRGKTRRIWAALLSLAIVASMFVVPASANENSQEKIHDYLDWLDFDSEIIKVDWEAYEAYPDWKLTKEPETFYRPIVYVPLGTEVKVKNTDKYGLTHDFTTKIARNEDINNIEGAISVDDFITGKSYLSINIFSKDPMKFGVYNYTDVSVWLSSNTIACDYTLYIVGVDENATGSSNNFNNSVPGLEEYVVFSTPYIGTDKGTTVDMDTMEDIEITIYEFSVGTKFLLTEKAINSGYHIAELGSFDVFDEYYEMNLTNATAYRYDYLVNSNSDPEGFMLYLRPVNTNVAFDDVKADSYYSEAVKWAVKYGVTSGTSATNFSPDETCTTGQILTLLWRAKGAIELHGEDNPFTDVSERDYYYNAAIWADICDLVSGTKFNADTPCTRSATVTYLWKMAGKPSVTADDKFTDVPVNADYAQAVAWAVSQGITAGTSDTTFSPNATCTRGQIATFLYRAMGK